MFGLHSMKLSGSEQPVESGDNVSSTGSSVWFIAVSQRGYVKYNPCQSLVVHLPDTYDPLDDDPWDENPFPTLRGAFCDAYDPKKGDWGFITADGIRIVGLTKLS